MAITSAESSRDAIRSLLKIWAGISLRIWVKVWAYPGVETPLTPDELGDLTLVMLCKVLGYMAGDGLSSWIAC
jgi:hypothetical protein